jgi:AcrR family transcriptional regulator
MARRAKTRRPIRKRQTPTQRGQHLMAVALELFSQRDFNSVSIKDIAAAAGVNTALIYYYFENKEGLFRSTLENAVSLALEKYRRLKERHSDPVDLIGDWFDAQREVSGPIRQLVKIMLDYSASRTQATVIDQVIAQFYNEELAILAGSVARGIQLGIFHAVDPERAARFASTHLDGIFTRSMIHQDYDLSAGLDELKALFWEYLGHEAVPVVPLPAARRMRDAG